jgi:hypothetical protein
MGRHRHVAEVTERSAAGALSASPKAAFERATTCPPLQPTARQGSPRGRGRRLRRVCSALGGRPLQRRTTTRLERRVLAR